MEIMLCRLPKPRFWLRTQLSGVCPMQDKITKSYSTLLVCLVLFGMMMTAGESFAEVKVRAKTTYYDVRGKTGKVLNENMISEGRKHITISHAIAATRYDYDYTDPKIVLRGNRCEVEHVDVIVNIEYIYPRWLDQGRASAGMRRNWATFWKALKRHEEEHGKIAIEAGRLLEKEIRKMHGNAVFECRDMGRLAGFRLANVLRKTAMKQRAFDRREYSRRSQISKLQRALYESE